MPAIEQAISEGINVNVTLLFAVEAYEKVAEAYIRGLERRLDDGQAARRALGGVVLRLARGHRGRQAPRATADPELHGIAAIANARAAYQRFKAIFAGERWDRLAAAGAVVQRPLWASTSVKDPAYPDTMYVDELVAPNTVNTMPMATLLAAAEQGRDHRAHRRPGPDRGPADARRRRHRHGRRDPRPARRRHRPVRGRDEPAHRRRRAAARSRRARSAAHARGPASPPTSRPPWPSGSRPPRPRAWPSASGASDPSPVGRARQARDREPAGLADHHRAHARAPRRAARLRRGGQGRGLHRRRAAGDGRLVAGPGGDPAVVRRDRRRRCGCRCSTRPTRTRSLAVERSIDLDKTLFVVSSKSGGDDRDALALPLLLVAAARRRPVRRRHRPRQRRWPTSVARNGFRRVFENDPNIGGRYSVLSYFGLVPAALDGRRRQTRCCSAPRWPSGVCGVRLQRVQRGPVAGAVMGELARRGATRRRSSSLSPSTSFGLWVEQLVAESTGKQGRGHPARRRRAARATGGLRRRPRVRLPAPRRGQPDADSTCRSRRWPTPATPRSRWPAHGPTDLGRIFFFAEFAIAVAGWVLEINPFDQPNVQEAKDNTNRVLQVASPARCPASPRPTTTRCGRCCRGQRRRTTCRARLPPRSPRAFDAAVADLRDLLRRRTGCATTFGYGPALPALHRPVPQGRAADRGFLQLVTTADERRGRSRAPAYTFGTLTNAAAGRRPADAARPRPARPSACGWRATRPRRCGR